MNRIEHLLCVHAYGNWHYAGRIEREANSFRRCPSNEQRIHLAKPNSAWYLCQRHHLRLHSTVGARPGLPRYPFLVFKQLPMHPFFGSYQIRPAPRRPQVVKHNRPGHTQDGARTRCHLHAPCTHCRRYGPPQVHWRSQKLSIRH